MRRLPLLPHGEALDIVHAGWMADAACRDHPGSFEAGGAAEPVARLVCANCPVPKRTCATYGILTQDRVHILGGTSPAERRELDNGQRWSSCGTCGADFIWNKTSPQAAPQGCPNCVGANPTDPMFIDPGVHT